MDSGQKKDPRDFVEEGIQHVQQNKVNAKNAFELQCIENMDVVLNALQSDEDFHFAATTIESSAKIYGFRVDNVHAETFKVRNLFDNYEDADAGPDKPSRKLRQVPVSMMKAAHCKTANELNIPDFDAMDKVENVDPFFAQMTHKTEKGGDQGLLLNLMPSDPRAGVIFNGQVPLHVDESSLDDELERQKMSSESRIFKQVSAMLKEVTTAKGVMAPYHYEYLRECAKEGVFGAEQIIRSPATSPGRRSQSALAGPEVPVDTEMPDVMPFVSPADLASIQMELSDDVDPLDAPIPDAQALLDQSEEELAVQELESMAIVEEKVVKKRAPKNLKKDRKPRSREERKNLRKEFFDAIDAEGNVISENDKKRFLKGEGGLPPEQGQSAASKALLEDIAFEEETSAPIDVPPEPEPLDAQGGDEVSYYKELINAIYKEKNPAKLGDLDTLFEKYDTLPKLEKMYDFICKKYEVTDAPALLAPPAPEPDHAFDAPVADEPPVDYGMPEPDFSPAPQQATPDAKDAANLPSLQASWLKAKRSTIRVPIVVNALEKSVSARAKHEEIPFSKMMQEARSHLNPNEKNQLTVGIAFISLLHLANDQNLELIQGDDIGDFSVNLEKKGTDHHKEQISKVLATSRKKPITQSPSLVSEIPTATPSSKKAKTEMPKSAKTAGKTSEAPAPSSKKLKVDLPTMTPDNPPPQKKASTPEKTKAVVTSQRKK
jgi:chromatin segregation and condensation protein Rec8/ScpA/Scc1 (kleisin family)